MADTASSSLTSTNDYAVQLLVPEPGQATDKAAGIIDLARRAQHADGDPPFSDQTLVDLRAPAAEGRRVRAAVVQGDDGELVGAAVVVLVTNDDEAQATLEMVVDPEHREKGIASALLTAVGRDEDVEQAHQDGQLSAWAHGAHPGAAKLAEQYDFHPVRELLQLERPASGRGEAGEEEAPDAPVGILIRTFDAQRDVPGLLRANRAAFEHHPEQGSMTTEDLRSRMEEDWFDAEGLFLAERVQDGVVVGFHWTKIDPGEPDVGEIYVLGVAPDQQGTGLGKVLTARGLDHLRERGVDRVGLYVEADNEPALSLYTSLGFERIETDLLYGT